MSYVLRLGIRVTPMLNTTVSFPLYVLMLLFGSLYCWQLLLLFVYLLVCLFACLFVAVPPVVVVVVVVAAAAAAAVECFY